ncbi:hypothetical protein H0H93_004432 [Arthromyces matolae]|nr:hypothetical protein H0H93_004432 [Arthromyces matolae]
MTNIPATAARFFEHLFAQPQDSHLLDVRTPSIGILVHVNRLFASDEYHTWESHQFYVNEVVLGTAFGMLMGPHVADVFNPRSWDADTVFVTREVTRIVLATGLFAIGVELPKSYMAKHVKSLLVMVVPTMAIGWVVVAGGRFAQRHVPRDLRQILAAESAANDGLAFPFLTISLYLILDKTREEAVTRWRGYIDRESYVAQYLALAIFVSGVVSTIGSDDLLAAFAAGAYLHFNRSWIKSHQEAQYHGTASSTITLKAKLSRP